MGYIQNQKHFVNLIKKIARESGQYLSPDHVLPLEVYVKEAYEHADEFTWGIRQDITLLYAENFYEWLRYKRTAGFSIPQEVDQITTEIFHEKLEELRGISGVYSFWSTAGTCLYVGVSVDLSRRILSSFLYRFRHYSHVVFLRYIPTRTASDAAVLETLCIAKTKPVLNRTAKFEDECTLPYDLPPLSIPIPCNKEGLKVNVQISNTLFQTRMAFDELVGEGLERDPAEKDNNPYDWEEEVAILDSQKTAS